MSASWRSTPSIAAQGFPPWKKRFRAEIAEGTLGGRKVLLLKPQTYMNESGRAVGDAANFYKVDPGDILVVHDEVDLAPGKIRMKRGGGAAGHNGLRSIDAAIGDDYRRLRIGVGHPGVKEMVPIHVLHDFAKSDRIWLDPLIEAIADNAALLAAGDDAAFANRLHAVLRPEKPEKVAKAKVDGKAEVAPKQEPKPGPKPAPADAKPARDAKAESPLARGLKKLFGRDL